MIEHDHAAVETNAAVREFQIVDRIQRELRLDKIFKIVTPIAEAAAEREGEVHFIENFIARHERIEHVPGIAELFVGAVTGNHFATRAVRNKPKELARDDK